MLTSDPPQILSIRESDSAESGTALVIEVRGDPQHLFDPASRELLGERLMMPDKTTSDGTFVATIRRLPGENIFQGKQCCCGMHPADHVLACVGALLLLHVPDQNKLLVVNETLTEGPPDPVFALSLRSRLLTEAGKNIALMEIMEVTVTTT